MASRHRKKAKEAKEQQGRAQTTGGLGQNRMELRARLVRFMMQRSLVEEDTHEKSKTDPSN
jgi:hypothetical protein